MKRLVWLALFTVLALTGVADHGRAASSSPDPALIAAAKREGNLVLYSNFRVKAVTANIARAFQAQFPFITVKVEDGDGASFYRRFLAEAEKGSPHADIVWSSAMDLQEKLINDGYALPYRIQAMASLPTWAHWKDLGYGTTYEPVVLVYNRKFLRDADMPTTHARLRDYLDANRAKLRGRVAIYDPRNSEVGMMFLAQDTHITPDTWNLFEALGNVSPKGFATSKDMIASILSGKTWMGYDVIGSYVFNLQKENPELGVVYPTDYMLVMSRAAFISKHALHPAAAKLFLDFIFSPQGQELLTQYHMGSVISEKLFPADLSVPAARLQGIRMGPSLLADLDSLVRAQFLRRWDQAMAEDAKSAALQ